MSTTVQTGAKMKGWPGRPPKHAARMLHRLLAEGRLDRRTSTAKLLRLIADDLAADSGGYAHLTAREKLLIDRCAAQAVILQTIENYVFTRESPFNTDGELLPVLRKGYVGHLNTLRLNLIALGLRPDRVEKQLPTLSEYIAARQTATAPASNAAQAAHDAASAPNDAGDGQNVEPDNGGTS